jgi:two-component system CheB/CheR fusion protein
MILAIGTSGAKLEVLVRVLNALSLDAGLAVVLAFQQRKVVDDEHLRQALGERASALTTVTDGEPVLAGRIYLSDADVITTLEEGRLRTRPAEQAPGDRGTIDSFFVSMAEDQDGNTIGLVLGETDGDGTLGVAAIKEAGGLTLAEDGDTASAKDLISSKSPVALVDLILPVEEIADRIALHARHHARLSKAAETEASLAGDATRLAQIAAVLRDRTGHDFHGYKRGTFLRRVQRRMQVAQVDKLESYLAILRAQPEEAQALFNDLLIGVTRFFRDRREFEFLEQKVVPELFDRKGRGDQLRVWVLGCSTGEEAYSIAIILSEYAATLQAPPRIQIFASDIDGRALAVARVGRYKQTIAADMTPQRLGRWFVKEGDTYCIAKELRELCIFSQHSIVRDPPFSRLDIVSCRNLLIYLDGSLQSRVIPLFHFALKPNGILFLGNSENVSRHAQLFKAVDRAYRVFRKLDTDGRVLPDLPFLAGASSRSGIALPPRSPDQSKSVAKIAARIVERYAPAYAVIDEFFDVVHFSAQAGRFIHPAGGAASLNLPSLVHNDLRPDLRGVLNRAVAEQKVVRAAGVPMRENGCQFKVDLVVEPIVDDVPSSRGFVVLFHDERWRFAAPH